MAQWWNTSEAAWGTLLLGIGVGTVLTYVSPHLGIPVGVIISLGGIVLIIRAHRSNNKYRVSLKREGSKVLIGLGIFIILAGIAGGGFLIKSQLNISTAVIETKPKQPDTIVYCCIRGNTYQVWAHNRGNNRDAVYITLGTGGLITDVQATMGASLPTIIEGGKNANFITFKIDELPPDVSLTYLVDVRSNAEQPHKFTAWSAEITSDISTNYVGQCPEIIKIGPEETVPR